MFGWLIKNLKLLTGRTIAYQLLYLRRPGGFSVREWEQAIAATPNTRVIRLNDTLAEVGDEQVWVSYGGPAAQVRLATHVWRTKFFYQGGYVYFELFDSRPSDPFRLIALRFSKLLGARIEDEGGLEQAL